MYADKRNYFIDNERRSNGSGEPIDEMKWCDLYLLADELINFLHEGMVIRAALIILSIKLQMLRLKSYSYCIYSR